MLEEDPDMKPLVVPKKLLAEAQAKPFDGKKNCWIPHEKEGFLEAEIQTIKGEEITVKVIKMAVS